MLLNSSLEKISLKNQYINSKAFLILGGPSFGEFISSDNKILIGGRFLSHRECLRYPGFVTMSVNNSVKTFRPDLWTCVDPPNRFIKSTWLDPRIQKFIPECHKDKQIFDSETWETTNHIVKECPNIFFYHRNDKFNHETFLTEDTFNWGNHKDLGGGRSVMLVAIRMLYYLGIRTVYLLGCDFKMDFNKGYHFDQGRSISSQNNNNSTYMKMQERFTKLRPIFEKEGFHVFNCNPNSQLTAFPYIDFESALKLSVCNMPRNIINERTEGLYERDKDKKDKKNKKGKNKPSNALDVFIQKDKELQDKIKKLEVEMEPKYHRSNEQ
jgi:hypothetical protein